MLDIKILVVDSLSLIDEINKTRIVLFPKISRNNENVSEYDSTSRDIFCNENKIIKNPKKNQLFVIHKLWSIIPP